MNYVQTAFAPEHRTPPLPLIALVGCPEVHRDVGDYFVQTLRPPLVSISSVEPLEQFIPRAFGPGKMTISLGPPTGIIKAEWFAKHRGKKPAVALAFVTRAEVEGDPNTWNRMLYALKLVRDATYQCGAGMVVAVLQADVEAAMDLPPDRVTAICHNLSMAPRLLCTVSGLVAGGAVSSADERTRLRHDTALAALGRLVHEQCMAYYLAQSQHVERKAVERSAAEQGPLPPQMVARMAFKLAVFAEFRQDWDTAVRQYGEAYRMLHVVPLGVPLSVQLYVEVLRVAELVHLKLLMLLLHQGKTEEALAQARRHLAWATSPPEPLAPPAAAWHCGMAARQYQLTSEVVGAKIDPTPLAATNKDLTRPFLLTAAARAAIARRSAFEALQQQRASHPLPIDGGAVRKGAFVGQAALRNPNGGSTPLSPSDYLLHLEYEELRVNSPAWCQELLGAALLVLRDSRQERLRSQLGMMLAGEHMHANNLSAARKLLLQVAHTYRREGWELPLVTVLDHLREVAQRLRMPAEHLVYCLELAVLAAGGISGTVKWTDPHALQLCRAAVQTLLTGVSDIKQGIMKQLSLDHDRHVSQDGLHADTGTAALPASGSPVSATSAAGRSFQYTVEHLDLKDAIRRARESEAGSSSVADMLQRHSQPDFGWWRCIAVAPAFAPAPADPKTLDFYVGLRNQLPVPLPLRRVVLKFSDDQGEWSAEVLCRAGAIEADAPPHVPPSLSTSSVMPATSPLRGVGTDQPPLDGRPPALRYDGAGSSMLGQDQGQGLAGEQAGLDRMPGDSTSSAVLDAAAAKERGAGQVAVPPSAPGTSGSRAESRMVLDPGRWSYASLRLQPRATGRLRCESVTLHIGEHSSVTFRVSSFPPGPATLGNLLHETIAGAPFHGLPSVLLGSRAATVAHIGPLPTLKVESMPQALLGEWAPFRFLITAHGPLGGATLELATKTAGITFADLTLIVDAGGTLQTIQPEGNCVPLPPVMADTTLHVRAWLQCRAVGRIMLAVLVSCPALVQQTVDMQVEEPFEHKCRLASEPGVHTLTLPKARDAGLQPLTIGQPAMLTTLVRAQQAGRIQLLDAQVDVEPSSGLMPVSDLRQQLRASAPLSGQPAGELAGQGLPVLNKSDVHAFVLPVVPTRLSEGGVALGQLRLSWQRLHEPSWAAWAAAAPSPLLEEAPAALLDLPRVSVQESVLTARTFAQAQATAGIAFSYSLQVQNFSAVSHELSVSLMDAPGFVLSGERTQAVALPVRESATVVWLLVAHAVGYLSLPTIRVTSPRNNCSLMTQTSHIYVLPF